MKLLIEITEYNKEWIENASEIPQEINVEIANAIRNGEQKTGEWVRAAIGTIAEGYYCSRCGKHGYCTDFCENCGADMRGEEYE